MAKREYLHEWMHRFETGNGSKTLRVWTKRHPDDTWPEGSAEFQEQHAEILGCADLPDGLEKIAGLKYVNAVEELDQNGNGRLVYVDWP